ncbi:MAG: DNA-directed RNA polymerase subunit omega [Selenomonadaceae bacterium]|nr:DNA-directed RNA polymerase subunit omega [Selenomonadaceae bacterium]
MKTNVVMSMVNPSTDALMGKVDSRYGLVVLAARRARQLMMGAEVKAKNQSTKNVTNALEEIVEGKITYEIVKELHEEQEAAGIEVESEVEAEDEVEAEAEASDADEHDEEEDAEAVEQEADVAEESQDA